MNAAQDDVVIIDSEGFVRIEWSEVGVFNHTECRLTTNGVDGEYELCEYHMTSVFFCFLEKISFIYNSVNVFTFDNSVCPLILTTKGTYMYTCTSVK